ncbi:MULTISPECIES: hypothetical protein [Actinokineospora]|uniref:Uncharacterized protein n=1 Tax=Actinokineospora fastidiosa TaxID=1816 RepID=A0A918L9I7_9PSEU|nr:MULTISPECIES: hypothetical protein [Actinokineospora]UVS82278.1 hypothetical protein Actkin_06047 [Actinokineospora sp. UTMC 2448]GGS22371.1 hypothetical protein GCM10010171_14000 [Actinokineospora fastidiosa]
MVYLLAAVGALTIAVLMWRAFGPQTADLAQRRRTPLAPDDDPDFLRKLDENRRRDRDEDTPPA